MSTATLPMTLRERIVNAEAINGEVLTKGVSEHRGDEPFDADVSREVTFRATLPTRLKPCDVIGYIEACANELAAAALDANVPDYTAHKPTGFFNDSNLEFIFGDGDVIAEFVLQIDADLVRN